MALLDTLKTVESEIETITTIIASVPSPASGIAGIALSIEKIFGAALRAHAATSGKTVDEIMANWNKIAPVE